MEVKLKKRLLRLLPNSHNWFGWLSMALTILFAFLWLANTPRFGDDLFYRFMPGVAEDVNMWRTNSDVITSFSQIPEAVKQHYLHVNGRLGNAAFMALQTVPYSLIKCIGGVMFAIFAFLFWRWAGRGGVENSTLSIIIPILFWGGLQLNDMQSSAFQFSYIFSGVMMLGGLIIFFKEKPKPGFWGWTLLVLFALWHETFTISFGIFLAVLWLFNRRQEYLIALCILIIGALMQLSPSSQSRLASSLNSMNGVQWTQFVYTSWTSILAIFLWLGFRKRLRKMEPTLLKRFAYGFIAVWICALSLFLILKAPPRVHWTCDIFAICMIIMIVKDFKPIRLKRWLKVTFIVIYTFWGISLISFQIRAKNFVNHCMSEFQHGEFVVKDTHNHLSPRIPFWLMNLPHLPYNINNGEHIDFALTMSEGRESVYLVVPDSLYGKPFEKWPKVSGRNDMRFCGRNMIVRRHDGKHFGDRFADIYFARPTIETSPFDFLLGVMKGQGFNQTKLNIGGVNQVPFEYMGDSLEVVFFADFPRSFKGRDVIAIDI